MTISRRELLWRLGAGAAATAALPRLAEASIQGERSIELDTNGNAFGPSPRTIAALKDGVALAKGCPAAESDKLRDTIAAFHGVTREQVVLGCGSGEILRMAVHAFSGRGRTLVTAQPTFGLIAQYAARAGSDVSAVHLASDWSH